MKFFSIRNNEKDSERKSKFNYHAKKNIGIFAASTKGEQV